MAISLTRLPTTRSLSRSFLLFFFLSSPLPLYCILLLSSTAAGAEGRGGERRRRRPWKQGRILVWCCRWRGLWLLFSSSFVEGCDVVAKPWFDDAGGVACWCQYGIAAAGSISCSVSPCDRTCESAFSIVSESRWRRWIESLEEEGARLWKIDSVFVRRRSSRRSQDGGEEVR